MHHMLSEAQNLLYDSPALGPARIHNPNQAKSIQSSPAQRFSLPALYAPRTPSMRMTRLPTFISLILTLYISNRISSLLLGLSCLCLIFLLLPQHLCVKLRSSSLSGIHSSHTISTNSSSGCVHRTLRQTLSLLCRVLMLMLIPKLLGDHSRDLLRCCVGELGLDLLLHDFHLRYATTVVRLAHSWGSSLSWTRG